VSLERLWIRLERHWIIVGVPHGNLQQISSRSPALSSSISSRKPLHKKKRPKPLSYFFGLLMGFVPWDIP